MKMKLKYIILVLFLLTLCLPSFAYADNVHRVAPGETLSIIGKKYGLSIDFLLRKNRYLRNPNLLISGQVLIIPGKYYEVKSGDTLYTVSQNQNIPMSNLAKANKLSNWNSLYVGQVLYIPTTYKVSAGDTLYKISQQLNVPISNLARQNELNNWNFLYTGQVLTVPDLRGNQREDADAIDAYLTPTARKFPNDFYFKGSKETPRVALTFDDGPNRIDTNKVLDVLKAHNVRATFFLLGQNIYGSQESIKRIVAEGHTIGNHSWSHPDLRKVTEEQLSSEMKAVENTIYDIIGLRTAMMRPPYGFVTDQNISQLGRLNYKVVKWSVDSYDWRDRDIDKILINVLPGTNEGSIILFHDNLAYSTGESGGGNATIGALTDIIKTLKGQGYSFVTVDELLGIKPYK